jgi:hypothetical protein
LDGSKLLDFSAVAVASPTGGKPDEKAATFSGTIKLPETK